MEDRSAFQAFAERVRVASDIVAIVSDYVALKKNGRNHWGCCPFHNEKTPSFSVRQDKGFFYCFGCQTGGNVFNFIMKIENLSYGEAVRFLAEKAGIPLPQRERTPQELERERELSRLWKVQALARDFFYACLTKTNLGKAGSAYFARRGLSEETIERFQLGYAPAAWDKLSKALVRRGFSEETLVKAGLAVDRQSDGVDDRFRNRVIFPICDERGRVAGFGGRVLDDSQPKYLNSPESVIFNKRRILFGLDQAHKAIKSEGYALVVEGYMDVVTAHAHGILNAVASLGTAFTAEQGKKLLKYAPQIVFAYDSDSAGQNATLRALHIVRELGAQVRVLTLPDGKDPDEFLRRHGAAAFRERIAAALPLVDYQVERALRSADISTLEGKVSVVGKLVPLLAQLQNAVEVDACVVRLSDTLRIDEAAIRSELQKFLFQHKKDKNVKSGQTVTMNIKTQEGSAAVRAGRHIIRALWDDSSIIPYVEAQLEAEAFANRLHCEILTFLFARYARGETSDDLAAATSLSAEASAELSRCVLAEEAAEDRLQLVDDCIRTVRLAHLRAKYEEHRLKADALERVGDEGFLRELAESQRIKDEIKKIHDA